MTENNPEQLQRSSVITDLQAGREYLAQVATAEDLCKLFDANGITRARSPLQTIKPDNHGYDSQRLSALEVLTLDGIGVRSNKLLEQTGYGSGAEEAPIFEVD